MCLLCGVSTYLSDDMIQMSWWCHPSPREGDIYEGHFWLGEGPRDCNLKGTGQYMGLDTMGLELLHILLSTGALRHTYVLRYRLVQCRTD
jgi:hypothetical protein